MPWPGSASITSTQRWGSEDPTGAVWQFGINGQGQLSNVYDPNNHAWQFSYDNANGAPDQNDLNGIEDPNGNTTTLTYTPAGTNGGFVSSVTDPLGNETSYSGYDTYSEDNGETYAVTQDTYGNVGPYPIDTYQITSNMLQDMTVAASNGDPQYTATTEYVYNGTDTNPQEIVTDPMGNATTYDTDEVGNVLEETNSYGTTTTTYNQYDEPCWSAPPGVAYPSPPSCTDWPTLGQGATEYDADEYGNMQEVIDPTGVATETQHDGYGNPCWQSMPGVIENSWPSCSSPPADAIRYDYNVGGLLLSESTPDGSGSSYAYDTTTNTYNGYGEVTSEVSPDGNTPGGVPSNYTTTYNYDPAGRLYKVVAPMDRTTTAVLDAAGNVLSVTDPMGQVTSTAYDADERVCWSYQGNATPSCASAPSTSTRYVYDRGTSNPLSVEDPNGQPTNYSYLNVDVPNQPTTIFDPLGNWTSNVYDKDGNLCLTGTGADSLYLFNEPSCSWSSGYTYDTFDMLGNVMTSEDPSGNTTNYARGDAAYPADITKVTPPSGGSIQPTSYQYDSDGREVVEQEGNGNDVSTAYNPAGQKCWQGPVNNASATCSTAIPVDGSSWAFYHSGLPSTMQDVASSTVTNTTTWAYDSQGQMTQEVSNAGTVNYAYDYAGDNTCVSYPVATGSVCSSPASSTNTVADYGYDADGQMTSMSDWLGNSFSFGYDARSNLTSIAYPSSTTWTEDFGPYDADNNMTTLSITSPTYGTASYPYPVNADNELSSGGGVSYGYNAQDRLTSAGSESMTYEPNGEFTSDSDDGISVTGSYNADWN